MKILALTIALFPVVMSAACLPVNSDRILGRDLSAALPATLQIGYAPMAGSARVFTVAELQRIAQSNRVVIDDIHEVCFEFPMHMGEERDFIAAMRTVLPPDAAVRVVDMAKAPVPIGRIEFPLSGLDPSTAGSDGAQMWRGFVQYTGTRRMPVWARVAITTPYRVVVAAHDLAAGSPVEAATLRMEMRQGNLKREPVASGIDEVAGHVLQHAVKAGADIPLSLLTSPAVVHRGDVVKVEVRSGAAVLRFDAIAESSARVGDSADVRNPITGKILRVRVDSGANAVIVVGKTPVL